MYCMPGCAVVLCCGDCCDMCGTLVGVSVFCIMCSECLIMSEIS